MAYVSVDPLGKNLFIFGEKSKNIARQTRPFLSSVSEILVDDCVFKIVLFGIKKMRLDSFSLQAKAIWQRIHSCQLVWSFFVLSVVSVLLFSNTKLSLKIRTNTVIHRFQETSSDALGIAMIL